MDRTFGKELSNLLGAAHNYKNRQSNHLSRIASKSTRCEETLMMIQKKLNKSCASQNNLAKIGSKKCKQNLLNSRKKQQFEQRVIAYKVSQVDSQIIPQYFDECLGFMLNQESHKYNLSNYMNQQPQITSHMRAILLDWLIQLHYKYKMFPETLYAAVMILDKYLSVVSISKDNLQMFGTAALFIAAKFEETYQVPELGDLVHFSAKAFSKEELIKAEAQIIAVLNFDLIMITSFRFFEALGKISKMTIKEFYLAQYVLELSLLESRFLAYKPSILASSALYLINRMEKKTDAWPDLLMAATGYEEKELRSCCKELCQLLEKAEDLPNSNNTRKKFHTMQYHEVAKIRLQRRKV